MKALRLCLYWFGIVDVARARITAPSVRSTVPFQYAWRFHYGDDPSSPPESGPGTGRFQQDLQDYPICDGMEHNPNRFSEKDCRLACMYDPGCFAWQAFPIEFGRACYHGYSENITCTKPSGSNMGGGRRSSRPSPAFRTDYSFAVEDAGSSIDQHWPVVDAPHDFIAEYGNFTENPEDFKQGYLPRNASWYRKHFALPSEWQGQGATYVHFEGIFHHATIFLNGKYLMSHECGYTGFSVRLDNATHVRFGAQENVLAVRADASFGSGHWYEGGGIYRPVYLVHVAPTHIVVDGLFVPSETNGSVVSAFAELESSVAADAAVRFTLYDMDGSTPLASATSTTQSLSNPNTTALVKAVLHPPPASVKLWTTKTPFMYNVRAEVLVNSLVVDSLDVNVGFRTTTWTGQEGAAPFTLNDEVISFRGFSHHNSMGGLGVAIPERVELFRVQASRAMGANMWRMSHNPYAPALYALLDATGSMCWDENRDYGAKYLDGAYVNAMHDMVKRDRNHPSIVIWSFCNEFECGQFDAKFSGAAYRAAAYGVDPTRPVTANGPADAGSLDVQGFSHSANKTFVKFHSDEPAKASVLSECCSCESQRQDRGLPQCIADQNSPGLLPYVTGSLGVWTLMDYFGEPQGTGTSSWPYVSCNFGQFDIAGFPKPHAYWYSANWAQGFGPDEPGRPALPYRTVAHILTLPDTPDPSQSSSTSISAITTAPFAQLFVDGVSVGVKASARNERGEFDSTDWALPNTACVFPHNVSGLQCRGLAAHASQTAAECQTACCDDASCNTWQFDSGEKQMCWIGNVPLGSCGAEKPDAHWLGGQRALVSFSNATLIALASSEPDAKVLATHSVYAPRTDSSTYKLQLTLDVPSVSTGTGGALLLDGRDTGLVRCAIVDSASNNALVSNAKTRITWQVISGPGRVAGVSSGDPASHEWLKSHAVNANMGLARGMFRVTQDCTSSNREFAVAVDTDGPRSPTAVYADVADCNLAPIVVQASAPGFEPISVAIPVSINTALDDVFVVAAATAQFHDGFSYLDTFIG